MNIKLIETKKPKTNANGHIVADKMWPARVQPIPPKSGYTATGDLPWK
jgi:hypothetical protein